jgi:hypothetical protein
LWKNGWNPHPFGRFFKQYLVIIVVGDFSIEQNPHYCATQVMCDANKMFYNVLLANLEGFTIVDNSKGLTHMCN